MLILVLNDFKGRHIDEENPKKFRYLRGEKAIRGNFDFKGGVKTLAETMVDRNMK